MTSKGKIIGIIMIAGGMLILLAMVGWLALAEGLSAGGGALGVVLALLIILPLLGIGVFFFLQGGREEKAFSEVAQQRKLLGIIKAQGQVPMSDLVLELGTSYDRVKNWIYDLVDKGLYSGYINWGEGTLYSQQAANLRDETRCKQCGGEVKLAGKGVVACPFCGTEYFLS